MGKNDESGALDFARLLELSDLRIEKVYVDRWQAEFEIMELNMDSIAKIRKDATGPDGKANEDEYGKLLIAASVVGPMRFSKQQVDALYHGSTAPLTQLMKAINKLNGFDVDEDEVGKVAESFLERPDQSLPL